MSLDYVIKFELINNTDVIFQIKSYKPKKGTWMLPFPDQVLPHATANAIAQEKDGVDCRSAYTVNCDTSSGDVTVNASFIPKETPIYATDGDFAQYNFLITPPSFDKTTMTCVAEIQNK